MSRNLKTKRPRRSASPSVQNIHATVQYNKTFIEVECSRENIFREIARETKLPEKGLHIAVMKKTDDVTHWTSVKDAYSLPRNCALRVFSDPDSNFKGHSSPTSLMSPNSADTRRLIMEKLNNNSVLTSKQREMLIELMKNKYHVKSGKSTETTTLSTTMGSVKHKKLQVTIEATDVSAQTNKVFTFEEILSFRERMKVIFETGKGHFLEKKKLMRETYHDRRALIMRALPKVITIRELYPLLFSRIEIINEMERIFNNNIAKNFYDNVSEYAGRIVKHAPIRNSKHRTIKRIVSDKMDEDEKKVSTIIGSILLMSSFCEESSNFVHFHDEPSQKTVYPYIEANDGFLEDALNNKASYQIIAENKVLCETDDFLDALLLLISIYFIFNMRYEPTCYNTLVTFEKMYLGIKESGEKPSSRVLKIITWLKT